MPHNTVAVVGAAETTRLALSRAVAAWASCRCRDQCDGRLRLKPKDIDGIACAANETPVQLAHYLGITPTGSTARPSGMQLHDSCPARGAAIEAGLAKTILITTVSPENPASALRRVLCIRSL